MPLIIEQFDEFAARQKCNYIASESGVSARTGDPVFRFVFENGAVSDGSTHYEPSPIESQREEVQREYVNALLNREIQDFNAFKTDCLNQANLCKTYPNLPPPPADAPQQLRAGQNRIAQLRKRLEAFDAKRAIAANRKRAGELELRKNEERARQDALVSEIQSIHV